MRPSSLLAPLALALPAAQAQTLELKFGSNAGVVYGFGDEIAVEDGLALIEAPVALYDLGSGQRLRTFAPVGADFGERYGASIAMDDGLVVVGSEGPLDRSAPGAVYVFDEASGDQLHRLLPPSGLNEVTFGESIALDGGLIVVGSSGNEDVGRDAGIAYVFDAATGQLLHELRPPAGSRDLVFGRSVALDGTLALVGAPAFQTGPWAQEGRCYLFDASTGALVRRIDPAFPGGDFYFGLEVELSTPYAIVSSIAPGVSTPGQVVVIDTATGGEVHRLSDPAPSFDDGFGSNVEAEGTRMVIGATRRTDIGRAYVYDLPSGALEATIQQPDPSSGSNVFGAGVAVEGNTVVIGAQTHFFGFANAGAAYVYSLDGLGEVTCTQAPNSTGNRARIAVAGSASLSNQDLRLRANDVPPFQPGLFFSGTQPAALPLGNGTLCIGGALTRLSAPTFEVAGTITHAVDFGGTGAALVAGSVYFQAWYRDGFAGGAGSDVSDAVRVTLTP
ncbi:MAG: PQQ-binding-like beta-propeller repeat protein [Planctomycetota bacterium]